MEKLMAARQQSKEQERGSTKKSVLDALRSLKMCIRDSNNLSLEMLFAKVNKQMNEYNKLCIGV